MLDLVEAANDYIYLIVSIIGLIAIVVEARVKIQTTGREVREVRDYCRNINGKVQEHDQWIQRAKGRWGDLQ